MADTKKPSDEPSPVFKKAPFSDGSTLYTRRGRGLVDNDKMPYLTPKPGETMHQREDNGVEGYAKGGKVTPNNRFGFATPSKYTKR